jgi:phenylacetate-CoA ligase
LAAKHVPYYRKKFSESGIDIEKIKSIEQLGLLPILEKQGVRASSESFVDERLERNKLLSGHTSGTTGTPLIVYRDVWQNSGAFAFLDARFHSVAGMRRRFNRSVSVGGHLVTAPQRSSPPFWVHNRRWNQLYMSSYQLSPRYLGYYVDELRRFKGEYIEGYPSSIYAIAQYIVDNKLEPVPFKACFTSAETLFDYHRAAIKKAFCCRTYNQYGCAEMALFAAECERGSMHLSPEIGIVEVVDEKDRPVEAGQNGHVICTSLINRVQPFIRYRIGDIGSLKPGKCLCGSPLPMFDNIEGRIDAVLITRDGRRVGRLDPVFKGVNGIFEAQIVQDDYDKFRIRIVPGREYTEKDGQTAVVNLADRIGHADIRIEIVKEIERTAAGKFRAVVCNLPREQRE